jgi:putative membrane protein
MHMIQHLLLAGVPDPVLTGLPLGSSGLLRPRVVGDTWAVLAGVPCGVVLYTIVFSMWHFPVFYNVMMRDHSIHIVMHLMVMVTATMLWWPVAGGAAVRRPLNHGAQMLYLFLLGTPMMAVAALIVFSPQPLYEWYAFSPPLWGQTAPRTSGRRADHGCRQHVLPGRERGVSWS